MRAVDATARQRLNIILRKRTVDLLGRVTSKGHRSRFIETLIWDYARRQSRKRLRQLLEEDALLNRERDLRLVEEWAVVDAETWPRGRRSK